MRKMPKRSSPFAKILAGFEITLDLIRSDHYRIMYESCTFDGDLYGERIVFLECRFYRSGFGSGRLRFIDALFVRCELIECNFERIEMQGVCFEDCYFYRNNFTHGTVFNQVRLIRPRRLETNINLHFVQTAGSLAVLDEDLKLARLPPIEKWASWERLRTLGRLPLFGVSLSTLVAIPVVAFLLGAYNDQVGRLQEWASSHADRLPPIAASVLEQLASRLHRIPIPTLTFWLLISTFFLGTASLLYTLFCPARVKEFSLESWTNEIGRSALHYLPLSWRYRWVRVIVGVCYSVGGFGTLLILIVKLINAGKFIVGNTTLPWWQW
jgi:hypothetical protein